MSLIQLPGVAANRKQEKAPEGGTLLHPGRGAMQQPAGAGDQPGQTAGTTASPPTPQIPIPCALPNGLPASQDPDPWQPGLPATRGGGVSWCRCLVFIQMKNQGTYWIRQQKTSWKPGLHSPCPRPRPSGDTGVDLHGRCSQPAFPRPELGTVSVMVTGECWSSEKCQLGPVATTSGLIFHTCWANFSVHVSYQLTPGGGRNHLNLQRSLRYLEVVHDTVATFLKFLISYQPPYNYIYKRTCGRANTHTFEKCFREKKEYIYESFPPRKTARSKSFRGKGL